MSLQKEPPYRNKKILDYAEGQECQVKLYNVCNYDSMTVVACHLSEHAFGHGYSVKADDCCIAYCCSDCHDVIDGRVPTPDHLTSEEVKLRLYGACINTFRLLCRDGVLK